MLTYPFTKRRLSGIVGVIALGLLAGCIRTEEDLAAARVPGNPVECSGSAASACFFRNSPVKLLPEKVRIAGRPLEFFPIASQLEFVDGRNKTWVAPVRTLTDGASIPQIFVPIVGNPRDPSFINAAAVHDAYCGIGNEAGPVYHAATWQEVHAMFYDTLVVGGTPEPKAQLMFAAVWLGGPRWYPQNRRNDVSMDIIPAPLRRAALIDTRNFIAARAPSLSQLILYLKWKEWEMRRLMLGKSAASSLTFEDFTAGDGFGGGQDPTAPNGGVAGGFPGP